MNEDTTHQRKVWIRPDEVCRMIAVSPRTLKRYVSAGTFPNPIKLTSRTSVWFEHEVMNWMDHKAEEFRQAA